MTKPPKYWNKAKKYLSKKDKTMAKLIKYYQNPSETILTSRKDIFFSLCKSIIGQQISVSAANAVFLRFKKKCKNRINAKSVSKLTFNQLKSCGLSRQKVMGIKSLAKQTLNKSFNPRLIKKMSDEEAINYITKLKGLGIWSAEMFLMFNLNRPNIFPVNDIGLLRAISKNYKTVYPPSKKFLNKISKMHDGYKTVFTWYMWRSIDPTDVEY